MSEFDGLPLVAGSVIGVRSWDVDEFGRLEPVNSHMFWRPGENVARCGTESWSPTIDKKHDMSHGSCGYYAYYDGSNTYRRPGRVAGVVEGYGQVMVGTKGFRAQKARVVALHLPRRMAIYPPLYRLFWRGNEANDGAMMALFGFCVVVAIANLFTGVALEIEGQWRIAIGVWALLSGIIYLEVANVLAAQEAFGRPGRANLTSAQRVARNYPDVPVYRSYRRMLHAHPIEKAPERTPDNDPTFWEQ